jgi:membrane protein DedA with SNARE-associated domain
MRYIQPRPLLAALSLPLLFIFLIVGLKVVWWLLGLPHDDDLIAIVRGFFDTYGLAALFIGALIEGMLVLGFYFPGGLVIFLSVVIAGKDIPRVATVVALVSAAFTIGLSIDYFLGKYGWHRVLLKFGFRQEMEKAERRLERRGLLAILFTYWDVNLASFTATAAGVLRYPWWRFVAYSAIFITLWNSVWAAMIYFIGTTALRFVTGRGGYAFAVIGIWVAVIVVHHVIKNARAPGAKGI